MGERDNHIFIIGSPDIDVMMSKTLPSMDELRNYYEVPFEEYAILIFHPVTTELGYLEKQIDTVIASVVHSKTNFVVIYPNNDPGSKIILNAYKQIENNNRFRMYPSLRFEYFLTLLKHANFIIGNSSVGITEAGVYGVPKINIGNRQKNRTKNKNIKNIQNNQEEIQDAIEQIKGKKIDSSYDFGNGQSSKKFFDIISEDKVWDIDLQKYFVEMNNED